MNADQQEVYMECFTLCEQGIAEIERQLIVVKNALSYAKRIHASNSKIAAAVRENISQFSPILEADAILGMSVSLAANFYHVDPSVLQEPNRSDRVVLPRQLAMYLARECGLNLTVIGKHFDKDHGTVLHACKNVANQIDINPVFASGVAHCLNLLRKSNLKAA